jgi:hypothetical protein
VVDADNDAVTMECELPIMRTHAHFLSSTLPLNGGEDDENKSASSIAVVTTWGVVTMIIIAGCMGWQ